jgi:hypothetical protein
MCKTECRTIVLTEILIPDATANTGALHIETGLYDVGLVIAGQTCRSNSVVEPSSQSALLSQNRFHPE